jgi:hypothetical protein
MVVLRHAHTVFMSYYDQHSVTARFQAFHCTRWTDALHRAAFLALSQGLACGVNFYKNEFPFMRSLHMMKTLPEDMSS